METISLDDFKNLKPAAILRGPCLNVSNGKGIFLFTVIVHPEGGMKERVEAFCSQIDASRGNPSLLELVGE